VVARPQFPDTTDGTRR